MASRLPERHGRGTHGDANVDSNIVANPYVYADIYVYCDGYEDPDS